MPRSRPASASWLTMADQAGNDRAPDGGDRAGSAYARRMRRAGAGASQSGRLHSPRQPRRRGIRRAGHLQRAPARRYPCGPVRTGFCPARARPVRGRAHKDRIALVPRAGSRRVPRQSGRRFPPRTVLPARRRRATARQRRSRAARRRQGRDRPGDRRSAQVRMRAPAPAGSGRAKASREARQAQRQRAEGGQATRQTLGSIDSHVRLMFRLLPKLVKEIEF